MPFVTELELELALEPALDVMELTEDELRIEEIDNDELELRKLDEELLNNLDEAVEDVAPTIP